MVRFVKQCGHLVFQFKQNLLNLKSCMYIAPMSTLKSVYHGFIKHCEYISTALQKSENFNNWRTAGKKKAFN